MAAAGAADSMNPAMLSSGAAVVKPPRAQPSGKPAAAAGLTWPRPALAYDERQTMGDSTMNATGVRILLAVQDGRFRSGLHALLLRQGYRVAMAESPDEALNVAGEADVRGAVIEVDDAGPFGLPFLQLMLDQRPQLVYMAVVRPDAAPLLTAIEQLRVPAVIATEEPDGETILPLRLALEARERARRRAESDRRIP